MSMSMLSGGSVGGTMTGASSLGPTDNEEDNVTRIRMVSDLLEKLLEQEGARFGLSDRGMLRLRQIPEQIGTAVFWTGPVPSVVKSRPSTSMHGGDADNTNGRALDDFVGNAETRLGEVPGKGHGAESQPGSTEDGDDGDDSSLPMTATPYFELVREHQLRKKMADRMSAFLQRRIASENALHVTLAAEIDELQAKQATSASQAKREKVMLSRIEHKVSSVTQEARRNEELTSEAQTELRDARFAFEEAREQKARLESELRLTIQRCDTLDEKLQELDAERRQLFDMAVAAGNQPDSSPRKQSLRVSPSKPGPGTFKRSATMAVLSPSSSSSRKGSSRNLLGAIGKKPSTGSLASVVESKAGSEQGP